MCNQHAITRLLAVIESFIDTDAEPDEMDIQDACLAMEQLEQEAGAQSLHVTRLRRKLEKLGLFKESS